MKNRKLIVAFTAGAALLVDSGCGGTKEAPIQENPAPPIEPVEPDYENPAPPEIEEKTAAKLPSWDSVGSGHPEGATNPPRPVLVVDPDGRCFKQWTSGMLAPTPETDDRVEACTGEDCGTQVECPPKAAELLAAHQGEPAE